VLLPDRCKARRFCSAECQKADWPTHKHACERSASYQAGLLESQLFTERELNDIENWSANNRTNFMHLAAYKLYAFNPARSLVDTCWCVFMVEYDPEKRHARIADTEIDDYSLQVREINLKLVLAQQPFD
jgi:MYND finger